MRMSRSPRRRADRTQYASSCVFGRLQALNPHLNDITYDINDLFLYIDTLPDLCALVLDHGGPLRARPR